MVLQLKFRAENMGFRLTWRISPKEENLWVDEIDYPMYWIEQFPSKINDDQEPQNVTFFGNKILADIIHYGSWGEIILSLVWVLNPVISVFIRKMRGGVTHREIQGESHVKTEVEKRVLNL